MDEVASLLGHLASRDNAVRSQAEEILFREWLEGASETRARLLGGLAALASRGEVGQRSFAAVVFRRCAMKRIQQPDAHNGHMRAVDALSEAAIAEIRTTILEGLLASDQPRDTRHKIADCVAELARSPLEWPQALSGLLEASKSSDAATRACTFRVFATTPTLVEGSPDLYQGAARILQAGFEDSSEEVRVAATTAFSQFFAGLPKSTWSHFKPLLPSLLNVMEPLRVSHQGDELLAVLESLIELAGLAPKMFRPVFIDVVKFALAVAQDTEMDEGARVTALEFAITFADEAPQMCRREQQYAPAMVVGLLQMLLEIGVDDEDGSEWNAEDDPNSDEEEIHSSAKMGLDRLALALGGEVLAEPMFTYLPKLAESASWRERHACLIALSNVAEGMRDVLLPHMESIMAMVLPKLQDDHPRVQWAACNTVGQLSTDFAPEIQQQMAPQILPALISKLTPQSVFKVQSHAAAAVVNFAEEASREMLEPYLDDLFTHLLQLLQSPKRYVQEQVLTTIAIVADAAQSLFGKYCDTLMPMLMSVMQAETPREFRLLKAKAIECATLIALAVGKEKFAPYFADMVQVFARIQQEPADEDDPCQPYLVQAWGRICRVVGRDFVPYLSGVMPPLLTAAKAKVDHRVLDESQAQLLGDEWEVLAVSGQYIGINTAVFEDKANAIELLQVYADLKEDFYPYVPGIVQDVVLPGLVFFYNYRVREVTIQLIPSIFESANAAASPEEVLALWKPVLEKLIELIQSPDTEAGLLAEMLNAIAATLRTLGAASVSVESVQTLTQELGRAVQLARMRFEERPPQGRSNEADENDDDEFEEDFDEAEALAEDETLLDNANRLIHSFFEIFRTSYLQIFQLIMPVVQSSLESPSADAQEFALCALADMIEFTPEQAGASASYVSAALLQALHSPSGRVRQAASYALGLALRLGEFNTIAPQAVPALFVVAQEPRNDDHDASENATAALARYFRAHPPEDVTVLSQWIATLPVVEDKEAAAATYAYLTELIEKQNPAVSKDAGKIFQAVAQALVARAVEGKIAERVATATKTLLGSIPQDQVMEYFHSLSSEDQQLFRHIFS